MKVKIKNLEDLQLEIARLTHLKNEQEQYLENQATLLKERIESPFRVLSSFSSLIPGVGIAKDFLKGSLGPSADFSAGDWLNRAVRVAVPVLLNRTVLKKAGWIKKALVLFASETAAGQVTKDNVSGALNKLAKFIRPKKKKYKTPVVTELDVYEDAPEDHILGV